MKIICFAIAAISLNTGLANVRNQRIIYGEDNRKETFDATSTQKEKANSTAAMIRNKSILEVDAKHSLLSPRSFESTYSLCSDERFKNQPTSASCSGFLISPDVLVTAGHCITSQKGCEEVSFVFDYKVKRKTKRADVIIPKSKIFKCSQVIETKLSGRGETLRDYAVIKLDRAVNNRAALDYRIEGKVLDQAGLYVIGHPAGLPQKVTDGGKIFKNHNPHFFLTNLDTYGGNSGSGVFNSSTNVIEGILVRGARDFVEDSCGLRSNRADENLVSPNGEPLGESVSRITDVPSLAKLPVLFKLAQNGSLKEFKTKLDNKKLLLLTNKDGDTLLHVAARNFNHDIVNYLITSNININAQNQNLETPLHIAAYVNNQTAIFSLIEKGANLLIKDKFGVYPSGRTMLFSFRIRKTLRRLENKQANN